MEINRELKVFSRIFFKQCTVEIQSVHNFCMKISLQVPEVARPRAFRLKDHPSVIIFRDRSVLRDEERKREVSARYAVEAKRREEKRSDEREVRRKDRSRAAAPRWAKARPSEQESPVRRSLGASPWLRSVPGYSQLFFTLRANDRYVFSFQGWTYPFVGCLFLPSRRTASRDVQFPGSSIPYGKYSRRSFPEGTFTNI